MSIKLLDCTLRDGGQGLEDLKKNGIDSVSLTIEEKRAIAQLIANSGVDIVEIGCMAESIDDKSGFAIYQNIFDLSEFKPQKKNDNQMIVGLYIGPDTDLDKIPEHSSDVVDGIRVILRYSELEKSLNFCKALSKKGYKVFVQPMLTMRYTDDELEYIIKAANEMKAYALYFVDSFGYMKTEDVVRLVDFYEERLNDNICIGFHAHNNLELANSNVRTFLECKSNHTLIIDSCVMGMGQGAGNLQTELAIPMLNEKYKKEYSMSEIWDVCEVLNKFRNNDLATWGYSPVRVIPALYKTAYKYAVVMRNNYNMSYKEIDKILQSMESDVRHRYTEENLKRILIDYERKQGN